MPSRKIQATETKLFFYVQAVIIIGITKTMKIKIVIILPNTNGVNPLEIIMAKIGKLNGENLKNIQMQMEEQLWSVLNVAVVS